VSTTLSCHRTCGVEQVVQQLKSESEDGSIRKFPPVSLTMLATVCQFERVFVVIELGGLIMDSLALSALIALSYTSRTNYIRVQDYTRSKLITIFGPFQLPLHEVLWKLDHTGAIVTGAAALRAVAPAVLPVIVNTLDIVIRSDRLPELEDWLTYSHCYTGTSNHAVVDGISQFSSCISFTRRIHSRSMEIKVFMVDKPGKTYELIFHASNTANMNMITSNGLFTPYRSLLNRGLVAQNHVTNMVTTRTASGPVKAHQQMIDAQNNANAESQGLVLITPNSLPHLNNWCDCTHRSACPLVFRDANDSMCSFMRIFNIGEYKGITESLASIPTKRYRLPNVVWRLADVEDGLPGFAFHMSWDRIKKLHQSS
jgi:hypothetical protein